MYKNQDETITTTVTVTGGFSDEESFELRFAIHDEGQILGSNEGWLEGHFESNGELLDIEFLEIISNTTSIPEDVLIELASIEVESEYSLDIDKKTMETDIDVTQEMVDRAALFVQRAKNSKAVKDMAEDIMKTMKKIINNNKQIETFTKKDKVGKKINSLLLKSESISTFLEEIQKLGYTFILNEYKNTEGSPDIIEYLDVKKEKLEKNDALKKDINTINKKIREEKKKEKQSTNNMGK